MLKGGMSSNWTSQLLFRSSCETLTFRTKSPTSPQLLGAEEAADRAVEVEEAVFEVPDVDKKVDNSLPEEADTKVKNVLELLVGKTPKWELRMTVELLSSLIPSEVAVGSATCNDEGGVIEEAGIGMTLAVDTETG